jgi:hypothetical protein
VIVAARIYPSKVQKNLREQAFKSTGVEVRLSPKTYTQALLAILVSIATICITLCGQGASNVSSPDLKLLISIDQQTLAEPYPARITLHIHNASQRTLWLYHRARGKHPPVARPFEENRPRETSGGSTLEVKLQPAESKAAQAAVSAAEVKVFEFVGLPKPRLVKLAAGEDYEERAVLHWEPALAEGRQPLWGAYRLTVIYGASFSNANEFQNNLGATLWQGEVSSNTLDVELRPATPDAVGAVAGTAVGPDLQPRAGIRVSLSDDHERLINQQVTGVDGTYSFDHLPLSLYWITGRSETATEDNATFHHVELTATTPRVGDQLVFYPPEIYQAAKLQHKPVLFKVVDPMGKPVDRVTLDATWSNGPVLDDVKAATEDDGLAVMELLPGRNFVTLKRHGCADQEERADVAPGEGADSFKLQFECAKK